MELQGKIKLIGETQSIGSNGFRKRELVLTTEEQYPQHIMIEFTQDKCDLLNNYNPNEAVKVSINLRGREWTSPQGEVKYFNTLEAWRIDRVGAAVGGGIPQGGPSAMNLNPVNTTNVELTVEKEDDDLPF